MKQGLFVIILILTLATGGVAAASGPAIQIIDNKLSITAEAISLSRLLRLLDQATGMKSKVPPELANRNISVRFSDLNIDDGFRKIFQGQPIDYIVIPGQGIIVTALSQTISGGDSLSAQPFNPPPPQADQPFVQDNPQFFPPGGQPQPGIAQPFGGGNPNAQFNPAQQQQPAVIQTPLGPIPNPRANQPAQPNAPLTTPVQQNPFGSSLPAPFGVNSPFGTPNPGGTDIFGNAPIQNQNTNPLGMPSSPPGSFPGLNSTPLKP